MADEKVTYLQVIKPQRPIEVRDLALAAFYPRTQSTTPIPAVTSGVQSRSRGHVRQQTDKHQNRAHHFNAAMS
jgi:hypothetical protein